MKIVFLILLIFVGLFAFSNAQAVDYIQSCNSSGVAFCGSGGCTTAPECEMFENCDYSCPSPLPNSSLVGNNCSAWSDWSNCLCDTTCSGYGACGISGDCNYDCDEGYTWNGDSCEEIPPEQIELIVNATHTERYFFLDKSFSYGDLFLIFLLILILIFAIGDRIFYYFWSK